MKIIGVIILIMGIVVMGISMGHLISEIKKTNTPREVVSCSRGQGFSVIVPVSCFGDTENISKIFTKEGYIRLLKSEGGFLPDDVLEEIFTKGVMTTIQALYHEGWKIDAGWFGEVGVHRFVLSREKKK